MNNPCVACYGAKWYYGSNGMTPKRCKHCNGTGQEPAPRLASTTELDNSAWIQISARYDREYWRRFGRDRPWVEVVDSNGRTVCAFWIDEIQPQEDFRRWHYRLAGRPNPCFVMDITGYEWIARVFHEAEAKGYRIVNGGRYENGDPYITISDTQRVAP